ncbi:MAG: hypothetical protein KGI58_00900 [Patescibacteria group bacterium]|nr:hypothetical protein [Patescibacteria group bacterium]
MKSINIIKNKSIKWWVGTMACFMLFGFIGVFAYSKTAFLIKGVKISATINQNDASSPIVEVKGNAKNAIYLSLDGREIYIDRDGSFAEPVALLPGLSVVTLNAQDKFGKTSEKKFEVVYKENKGVAVANKIINTN